MVRRRRARRALDRRTSANKATALTQARLSPCADEYEAFRKAAIEDVTSSYKDLRREETELAREQKEVLQAIKDFLKRSETARKNVQKTSSSAKDACTLVLQCAALSNRLPRPAISTRSLARARAHLPRSVPRAQEAREEVHRHRAEDDQEGARSPRTPAPAPRAQGPGGRDDR